MLYCRSTVACTVILLSLYCHCDGGAYAAAAAAAAATAEPEPDDDWETAAEKIEQGEKTIKAAVILPDPTPIPAPKRRLAPGGVRRDFEPL